MSANDTPRDPHTPDTSPLEPNPAEAVAFVIRVFRPDQEGNLLGYLLVWVVNPRVNPATKRSHWFSNVNTLAGWLEAQKVPLSKQQVYLGMCLSRPDAKKGNAAGELTPFTRLKQFPEVDAQTGVDSPTCHLQPGLWADLDFGNDGHKGSDNGKNYPPTLESILDRMPDCPLQPSELVFSGHGLQALWAFPDLLDVSADPQGARDRLEKWLKHAVKGWLAPHDTDAVHDLSRVMRLPGFLNVKDPQSPKLVRSLLSGGPAHRVEDVDALLPKGPPERARPQPQAPRKPAQEVPYDPQAEPDPARLAAACENDPKFLATWEGNRPDLPDQSASGYDLSLANLAALAGWDAGEIQRAVIARRRKAGAKEKVAAYFTRTVDKALAFAAERQANQTNGAKKNDGAADAKDAEKKPSKRASERDQKAGVAAAVMKFICDVRDPGTTIHWLERLYERRTGLWYPQDPKVFRQRIQGVLANTLKQETATFSRTAMGGYMESLEIALLPPCADTARLDESDRLRSYNLDTGELVNGAAFRNAVVEIGRAGEVKVRPANPREFRILHRPYDWPESDPGRPRLFDAWLEQRMPDSETRKALWEALGATVLQVLSGDHRAVILYGKGGAGKGTILVVLRMLMGEKQVMAVDSPSRLVVSQFGLSQLQEKSVLQVTDMPRIPRRPGAAREAFLKGMGIIKVISVHEPVPIERKNADQITAKVDAGVWVDTNFTLSDVFTGEDESAWVRRAILIPMRKQLAKSAQIRGFESRFYPEIQQIAWAAVHAYAATQRGGQTQYTESAEMLAVMSEMREELGMEGKMRDYLDRLPRGADRKIKRSDLLRGLTDYLREPVPAEIRDLMYLILRDQTANVKEVTLKGHETYRGVGPLDPG